jgi:MraZ protein
VFRGQYEHAIDAKGRTSVPAKFREALDADGQSRLILTRGLDPCLVCWPINEWLAFEERLSKLPQFDASVAMIRRIYVSGAVDLEVDKLGRVLVPKELRDAAGLDREGLWAGMGRHIELWSKDRFDALRKSVLEDADKRADVARRLGELGL